MKHIVKTGLFLGLLICLVYSQSISLSGTVTDSDGKGLEGAAISLVNKSNLTATSDVEGKFTITIVSTRWDLMRSDEIGPFRLSGNTLQFPIYSPDQNGILDLFTANGRHLVNIILDGRSADNRYIELPQLASGVYVIRIALENRSFSYRLMSYGTNGKALNKHSATRYNFTTIGALQQEIVDTLIVTKTAYLQKKVPIDSYEKVGIPIVLEKEGEPTGEMPLVYEVENTGEDCNGTTNFPSFNNLPNIEHFPDPFLMDDGTRITKKSQWKCRRAEISNQIQYWELGTKPGSKAQQVTASFSNDKLTVSVTVGSKSFALSTSIKYPSSGTAPYPALIQMDGSGVPASIFSGKGCAIMSFTSSSLAGIFPTRGSGKFWELFPEDPTAGAYAGWSWGVSRLIDGLVLTADQNKIDTKHLAVTGCSYSGKMALWAGAFDERIALTVPEESGGGGEANWRYMTQMSGAGGPDLEDLNGAQGTGWYSSRLKQFNNSNVAKLPVDQHLLVAMIAPRAVLTCANADVQRLGSEAGQVSVMAASEVWKALGIPDRIGYTIPKAGAHCNWSNSATGDVESFVDRFLLGKTADSNIMKSPYSPNLSKWIPWETPTLQ